MPCELIYSDPHPECGHRTVEVRCPVVSSLNWDELGLSTEPGQLTDEQIIKVREVARGGHNDCLQHARQYTAWCARHHTQLMAWKPPQEDRRTQEDANETARD